MWKITTALVNWEQKNAMKKARKLAHKQNELNFLTRKNEINSSEFMNEKIVESCEVQEPTTKTVTQKVNSLTAGTYFVESKNVIPMRKELKRLGLNETHTVTKTAGVDHGVFPRKDKDGKVIGSTNKFNENMTQNKSIMVLVKNGKAAAWDRSRQ